MTGFRQAWTAFGATAALVGAAYVIIAPFLVLIGWAAIVAYATWPVHRRPLAGLGGRAGLAAFVFGPPLGCSPSPCGPCSRWRRGRGPSSSHGVVSS